MSSLGRNPRKAKKMDGGARQQRVDICSRLEHGKGKWVTFETGEFDTSGRAEWGPSDASVTWVAATSKLTTTTTHK